MNAKTAALALTFLLSGCQPREAKPPALHFGASVLLSDDPRLGELPTVGVFPDPGMEGEPFRPRTGTLATYLGPVATKGHPWVRVRIAEGEFADTVGYLPATNIRPK